MMQFNYEYEVIDIHNLGVYGLKERLTPYGNAGWVVNCSIGGLLILSRMKMEYKAPKSLCNCSTFDHEMKLDYDPCG